MSENIIKQTKDDKKFLIMAHRGFWGGNVIQNTRQAAITAKKAGAGVFMRSTYVAQLTACIIYFIN